MSAKTSYGLLIVATQKNFQVETIASAVVSGDDIPRVNQLRVDGV